MWSQFQEMIKKNLVWKFETVAILDGSAGTFEKYIDLILYTIIATIQPPLSSAVKLFIRFIIVFSNVNFYFTIYNCLNKCKWFTQQFLNFIFFAIFSQRKNKPIYQALDDDSILYALILKKFINFYFGLGMHWKQEAFHKYLIGV